jgi:5-methylcytosine-specific restriction endonuclease McrA
MSKDDLQVSRALQEQCGFGSWNADRGVEVDFKCEYCGTDLLSSVDAYYSWQIDHIIPQSREGEHLYENIAICCTTCNFMKRAYLPEGDTRAERIADAKRFIMESRQQKLAELNHIREVVGLPLLSNL